VARADLELVARGLAPSRSAAARLIADGAVTLPHGEAVLRPSQRVGPFEALRIASSDETRFVSRAGAKLAHALEVSGVAPRGRVVLDLGMSTGGFADCVLQAGAARVVGIEVGHGQLHARLRDDPRVVCIERLNVRDATLERITEHVPDAPPDGFDLALADLSFISLAKVLPALDALLAPGAVLLLLVKPQFEVGPAGVDGRGLVREPAARARAADTVADACRALGWIVHARFDSALPGGDGNLESFLHASVPSARPPRPRIPR
jgi:23S rRNA (cytidine1920-2'-O)/16S rRNA (cytidine1409-2'-O)-methyltransferase